MCESNLHLTDINLINKLNCNLCQLGLYEPVSDAHIKAHASAPKSIASYNHVQFKHVYQGTSDQFIRLKILFIGYQ